MAGTIVAHVIHDDYVDHAVVVPWLMFCDVSLVSLRWC